MGCASAGWAGAGRARCRCGAAGVQPWLLTLVSSVPTPCARPPRRRSRARRWRAGARARGPGRSHLWPALHDEHALLDVHAALDVLGRAVEGLLHGPACLGNAAQEVLPVVRVRDDGHAVEALEPGLVLLGAHGLEEPGAREALEVLAVAVGAEDEAVLRVEGDALAEEGDDPRLAAALHREAQRAAGEVAHQGLAAAGDELAVELVLVVREGVHCVQHERVLRLHELLHQHGHVQVVEAPARLGQGDPRADGEERAPNALDRLPSVPGLEEHLQPLLALLPADRRHGLEHRGLEALGHLHGPDEDLGLLEDELRVLVAGLGLQLAQDLLELLEHALVVDIVAEGLLHATVGQSHSLRREDVLRQLRLQEGQVEALRSDAGLGHL
mmetsp:Transcript_100072/g.280394  ORF Transcript_100072/g.280394 Transcript_100072/m.280394 type:complete len:385 (-) Transcript_100072:2418-3572(-)